MNSDLEVRMVNPYPTQVAKIHYVDFDNTNSKVIHLSKLYFVNLRLKVQPPKGGIAIT